MKRRRETTIRSFRFDDRVLAAMKEVARVSGSNPNRIAEAALTVCLEAWLEERLDKAERPAAR